MALLLALVVGTLSGGGGPGGGAAPAAGSVGLLLVPVTAGQEWCRGQAPSLGLKAASRWGEEVETCGHQPANPPPGTPAPHLTKKVGVPPWGVPPSVGSAHKLCFTGAETGPDPRSARGRRSRPPGRQRRCLLRARDGADGGGNGQEASPASRAACRVMEL